MVHQNRTILIVEDDRDIRETLQLILEEEGYAVMTAENGKVGLDLLLTAPVPFLIFLDLFMPVMDGSKFLTELKKSSIPALARVPVVIISAAPLVGTIASSVKSLTYSFIKKPFSMDLVLKVVRQICPSSSQLEVQE